MNYSSSDDSTILKTKRKSRISSKREKREKTGVSNSESDSEPTSALPNPPDLTINKEMPVKKSSNILEHIQEIPDLQVIDGSLVSHKSNSKFLFIVLLICIIFIILYIF